MSDIGLVMANMRRRGNDVVFMQGGNDIERRGGGWRWSGVIVSGRRRGNFASRKARLMSGMECGERSGRVMEGVKDFWMSERS